MQIFLDPPSLFSSLENGARNAGDTCLYAYISSKFNTWSLHERRRPNIAAIDEREWVYSVPRINTVYLEFGENRDHAEMARRGQSYDILPWLPAPVARINYAFDAYRRLMLEINPPDWRTTLSGNLHVYAHGLSPASEQTALSITFDFIGCAFWHTSKYDDASTRC